MSRFLYHFHDATQEKLRQEGVGFIPASNEHLRRLIALHGDFAAAVQKRSPQETATLDMDATLIPTNKKEALYCYKGPKAYQPLQVYWAEQDLVLHSEFRDGNVWAGTDNLPRASGGACGATRRSVEG